MSEKIRPQITEVLEKITDPKLRELLLRLRDEITESSEQLARAEEELEKAESRFSFYISLCEKGNKWVPIDRDTSLPEHVLFYDSRSVAFGDNDADILNHEDIEDHYGNIIEGFFAWL